jgi:hypothetical protein
MGKLGASASVDAILTGFFEVVHLGGEAIGLRLDRKLDRAMRGSERM